MSPPRWLRQLWFAALLVHLLLIAALAALVIHSSARGGWLLAVLATAPLLASLPGLLRGSTYTGAWASLIAAFYGPFLLADAYMHPQGRGLIVAVATLGALDFVVLTLWVKASAKQARQAG